MRCISLWQPHASLCVIPSLADKRRPVKPYETRSWPTKFRGRLLIQAAKRWTEEEKQTCIQRPFSTGLKLGGMKILGDVPRGAIVGAVTLVECYEVRICGDSVELVYSDRRYGCGLETLPYPEGDDYTFGDFSVGRFAWKLVDPIQFAQPIPYRGSQGFFDVPDEVIEQAALKGRAV